MYSKERFHFTSDDHQGDLGLKNAWEMSKLASGQGQASFLVMSTGVIGQHLQMDKISKGINELKLSEKLGNTHEAWFSSSEGIMTTDTFPKLRSSEFHYSSGQACLFPLLLSF